ncbi:MAG: hypothetical protein RIE08_18185 [Acidimicrobiales bacterium]
MDDAARPAAQPKPDELLALDGVTTELFELLRDWFAVESVVSLDLTSIDSAVAELGDPQMIAAMAMRKLQALNLIATPGVRTSTDVVIAIIQDLDRALLQAPSMALSVQASSTDWDRALADLADLDDAMPEAPGDGDSDDSSDVDDFDLAVVHFRELHHAVHLALEAVVRGSDGEIRYFE